MPGGLRAGGECGGPASPREERGWGMHGERGPRAARHRARGKAGPRHRVPPRGGRPKPSVGTRGSSVAGLAPGGHRSSRAWAGATLTVPGSGTPSGQAPSPARRGWGSGPHCVLRGRRQGSERRWQRCRKARRKIQRGRKSPGRIRPPEKPELAGAAGSVHSKS